MAVSFVQGAFDLCLVVSYNRPMNESHAQAILMSWCMEKKNHRFVLPNTRSVYYKWEADLLSATRAWLVHEYEIKLSLSDYRADANKEWKHDVLKRKYKENYPLKSPNYFWYVVYGFDLTPQDVPTYAGLIEIAWHGGWGRHYVKVLKKAPRLHGDKLNKKVREKLAKWLSYKLKNEYVAAYGN